MVTSPYRVFGCAANFCVAGVCVLRVVSGQSDATRVCQMPYLSTAEEPRETPARDCHSAGVLQQVPAYRLAHDLGVDPQVIIRVYQKLRTALFHVSELKGMASKLSGEIELDETYFGGRRKGRGAAGKSVVFELLDREGRVYMMVVEHVPLMAHLQSMTCKGSVYYTDAFRGYQSLRRYGKHHTVNNSKSLVDRRTITGAS